MVLTALLRSPQKAVRSVAGALPELPGLVAALGDDVTGVASALPALLLRSPQLSPAQLSTSWAAATKALWESEGVWPFDSETKSACTSVISLLMEAGMEVGASLIIRGTIAAASEYCPALGLPGRGGFCALSLQKAARLIPLLAPPPLLAAALCGHYPHRSQPMSGSSRPPDREQFASAPSAPKRWPRAPAPFALPGVSSLSLPPVTSSRRPWL
jgi:hypothetical protein